MKKKLLDLLFPNRIKDIYVQYTGKGTYIARFDGDDSLSGVGSTMNEAIGSLVARKKDILGIKIFIKKIK